MLKGQSTNYGRKRSLEGHSLFNTKQNDKVKKDFEGREKYIQYILRLIYFFHCRKNIYGKHDLYPTYLKIKDWIMVDKKERLNILFDLGILPIIDLSKELILSLNENYDDNTCSISINGNTLNTYVNSKLPNHIIDDLSIKKGLSCSLF